jgi:hypothetical protein
MAGEKGKGRTQKEWELKIYVAGETEKSRVAIENLRKVC